MVHEADVVEEVDMDVVDEVDVEGRKPHIMLEVGTGGGAVKRESLFLNFEIVLLHVAC